MSTGTKTGEGSGREFYLESIKVADDAAIVSGET